MCLSQTPTQFWPWPHYMLPTHCNLALSLNLYLGAHISSLSLVLDLILWFSYIVTNPFPWIPKPCRLVLFLRWSFLRLFSPFFWYLPPNFFHNTLLILLDLVIVWSYLRCSSLSLIFWPQLFSDWTLMLIPWTCLTIPWSWRMPGSIFPRVFTVLPHYWNFQTLETFSLTLYHDPLLLALIRPCKDIHSLHFSSLWSAWFFPGHNLCLVFLFWSTNTKS